jgi:hypothetical protein
MLPSQVARMVRQHSVSAGTCCTGHPRLDMRRHAVCEAALQHLLACHAGRWERPAVGPKLLAGQRREHGALLHCTLSSWKPVLVDGGGEAKKAVAKSGGGGKCRVCRGRRESAVAQLLGWWANSEEGGSVDPWLPHCMHATLRCDAESVRSPVWHAMGNSREPGRRRASVRGPECEGHESLAVPTGCRGLRLTAFRDCFAHAALQPRSASQPGPPHASSNAGRRSCSRAPTVTDLAASPA